MRNLLFLGELGEDLNELKMYRVYPLRKKPFILIASGPCAFLGRMVTY